MDSLVQLSQGKVGITHVLQHSVFLLELEAVLKKKNSFGGPAEEIESSSFIIINVDHKLIGLR